MTDPRGLITAIRRTRGSYLAELLPEQGCEVAGMMRRGATQSVERFADLSDRITLVRPTSSTNVAHKRDRCGRPD